MRVADRIELDAQVERELRILSKRRRVEARVQQRASVILLAAEGWQNKDIAVEVKLDRRQVALWRRRFIEGGVEALLQDASRSGRTPSVTAAIESVIVQTTLHDKPVAATHWSTRTLAAHLSLGATTIRRVWQRNGLKPHLQRTFKLSRDPRFEDVGRCRGALPQPARARRRAQLRREEPNPGAQPHPAGPADEARARRHHDARLQEERHNDPLRCAQHPRRHGHLAVPGAASPRGVVEVSASDRPQDAQALAVASDRR